MQIRVESSDGGELELDGERSLISQALTLIDRGLKLRVLRAAPRAISPVRATSATTDPEGPFRCPQCDRRFASSRAVGPHRVRAHPPGVASPPVVVQASNGLFLCDQCKSAWRSRRALSIHRSKTHLPLVPVSEAGSL
ncbi:MAG: hypothetical protein KGI98_11935 [Euryarchaeota archaeon]|nr:hypothetical protein [Euryarchaeota archaeon]MDE1881586.1 hypothetical protein [Euryarchaeota archaeon]